MSYRASNQGRSTVPQFDPNTIPEPSKYEILRSWGEMKRFMESHQLYVGNPKDVDEANETIAIMMREEHEDRMHTARLDFERRYGFR